MPVLLPFRHDWSTSLRIEESFATEIITSRNKEEQRRALRLRPRREVSFSVLETGSSARRFRSYVARFIQAEFEIPDWVRFVNTTELAPAASVSVLVDVVPDWVYPQSRVVLEGANGVEALDVDSVIGNEVFFASVLSFEHGAGSKLYPSLRGRISQDTSQNLLTSSVAEGDLVLSVEPGSEDFPEGVPGDTFRGRELFLTKPNWSTSPSVSTQGFLEIFDAQFGVKSYHGYTGWNAETFEAGYLSRGGQAVTDMLSFFRRMKGRRGSFYTPSWEFDVPVQAEAGSTLLIQGREFFDLYQGSESHSAVIAFYKDGSSGVMGVTGVTLSGNDSVLTFEGVWPVTTGPDTVQKMCWLLHSRFASDSITIEWRTDVTAEWKLSLYALKGPTT